MNNFILLLLISLLTTSSFAQETPEEIETITTTTDETIIPETTAINESDNSLKQIYKIPYIALADETLAKIYYKFVYPNSRITLKTPMNQMTINKNPNVKNWNKIEEGTHLDVYIAKEFFDEKKYQRYLKRLQWSLNQINKNNETENTLPGPTPEGFKVSFFYMASYGIFNQKDKKRANVEFYQNSPLTLGASSSYYPKKSNWSFASTAYAAYQVATGNNLDNSNLTVLPELGLSFYSEYRVNKYNFTGFFGLDYERFSTFNMGGIQNKRELILDENNLLYLTVGVSKMVTVFEQNFFTKTLLSHSLSSSLKSNSDGISSDGEFTGFKFLFYVNKKLNDHLYITSQFKYHKMSGPSELDTIRLSLGLGYIL